MSTKQELAIESLLAAAQYRFGVVVSTALTWGLDEDADSFISDAKSLVQVAVFVNEEKYIKAFDLLYSLDTIVRDTVSMETFEFIADKAEDEKENKRKRKKR